MRNFSADLIQREGLGSQVATVLREAIASGEYGRGERLIEVELATRFGVSRGPVRDAIRILELEGLVESQPPGMVVTGIDEQAINEFYSLRGAIEGLAVRLAVERKGNGQYEEIERHVVAMERAAARDDLSAFGKADVAFHNAICLTSGHRRLTDVWQRYEAIMMTLLRMTMLPDQVLTENAAKHRALFDLIRSGDAVAAEKELHAHLEGSRARMVRVWERAVERRRAERAHA